MSFDNTIAALITALNANTEALRAHAAQLGQPVQHVAAAPQVQNVPAAAQVFQQPAAQTMPAAAVMPGAPSFMPTATPAPAPAAAPFGTKQDLFNYTGAAYQAMGAEKGARIQGILTGMGIQNLNDLAPEQFGTFFAQVEALKASA